MSNPEITVQMRLRPDHLAAIEHAMARLKGAERELSRLVMRASHEAEPEPVVEVFRLAIVVDGAFAHWIAFATKAERDAYCAGFNRASSHAPKKFWEMVTPETYGVHEFDADTAALVRSALCLK